MGGTESLQQRLRREEAERQQGLREFQRGLSDRLQREEQQRQMQLQQIQEQIGRDTGVGNQPWLYRDSEGDVSLVPASAQDPGGAVWTGVPEGDRAPAGTKVVSVWFRALRA